MNNKLKYVVGLIIAVVLITTVKEIMKKNLPESAKSLISKMEGYLFESKEIVIVIHYIKYSSFEVDYDLEKGLKQAVSNGVNLKGGANLTFNVADTSDDNKKLALGTFQLGREIMAYKEMVYFNGKNEVGAIMIIGPLGDYTNQLISKIISSIEYLF